MRIGRLLAIDDRASRRRDRWADLFRIAERIGVVVTVRELLVAVAYAVTGGLRCEDVHVQVKGQAVSRRWQWSHLFFQILFDGMTALRRASPGLRIPPAMERLDPGRHANREIDEHLEIAISDTFRPYDPTGDSLGAGMDETSPEADRSDHLTLTRFLRRQAFFEDAEPGAAWRMGFRFSDAFAEVIRASDSAALRAARDRVIRGLSALQGAPPQGEQLRVLPIVEPALAGKASGVAIVNRHVKLAAIKLVSLSAAWEQSLQRPSEVPTLVDWLDRFVALRIEDEQIIPLDLRTFELVCAAGDGMDLLTVDPGVARNLLLQLAVLAESTEREGEITIVEPNGRWLIDRDGDRLIGGRT